MKKKKRLAVTTGFTRTFKCGQNRGDGLACGKELAAVWGEELPKDGKRRKGERYDFFTVKCPTHGEYRVAPELVERGG